MTALAIPELEGLIGDDVVDAVLPPEALTPSQWAERYRELSRRQTARAGRWEHEAAPYLRGLMDLCHLPGVHEVTIMKAAQVGASEAVRNVIAYWADQEPDPILIVLPNRDKGRQIMGERLIPLIEDTPRLARLSSGRVTDKNREKIVLRNGFTLWLGWSGSATALASHPVARVINDEVDKFEPWTGRESDPVSLGRMRTQTYHNRLIINLSTPTTREGLIAQLFEDAPRKLRYFVPCPHCGVYDWMRFDCVKWPKFEALETYKARAEAIIRGRAAWYECPHCAGRWEERDRAKAIARGVWADQDATVDRKGRISGMDGVVGNVAIHLPALICLFVTLSEIAAAFVEAAGDPRKLQNFRNSWLGEPFEQRLEKPDITVLGAKVTKARERGLLPGAAGVPVWATRLIATADTQKDRFPYVIRAWGHGWRSQRVEHGLAQSLDDLAAKTIERGFSVRDHAGREYPPMIVDALGIDTGGGIMREDADSLGEDVPGSRTDEVYQFGNRHRTRVKLIKGVVNTKQQTPVRFSKVVYTPPRPGPRKRAKYEVFLHLVDVGHFKDVLAERIRQDWPEGLDAAFSDEIEAFGGEPPDLWGLDATEDHQYEREMTSEHKVLMRSARGKVEPRWVPITAGAANHYWDCEVYQCAMAWVLRVDLSPVPREVVRMRMGGQGSQARSDKRSKASMGARGLRTPDGRPFFIHQRDDR